MEKISVVTGATSGIGFEVARLAGKNTTVLITGRSEEKVNNALAKLRADNVACEGIVCDVTSREQVRNVAKKANQMGEITAVYSVAGMSPTNGYDGEAIMRTNAFGVVYTNEEFSEYMRNGCFLNVSSIAAYSVPEDRLPFPVFDLALTDIEKFEKAMLAMCQSANMAYALSKAFVKYYTKKSAFTRGRGQGNRVVSVAPGVIDTKMTQNEGSDRAKASSLSFSSLNRIGQPEELAFCMVSLADRRNGFVDGVDILVDGGCFCEGYNGTNFRGQEQQVSVEELMNKR